MVVGTQRLTAKGNDEDEEEEEALRNRAHWQEPGWHCE
jgi:hypothetical protein